MTVELRPYTDDDLALTLALETDPEVMKELGGPRPREDLARVHPTRIAPTVGGEHWWFVIVPGRGEAAAGQIGIWRAEFDGGEIDEVGWMLLPAYQGRGLASQALALLLERVRLAGAFDAIHAFPGVTNAPSNALCRKFGFRLTEEREVDFSGGPLRVNHWVLAPQERVAPLPNREDDAGRQPKATGGASG